MDSSAPISLAPNVDRRRDYVILIWTLLGFATIFVSARMYMRVFVRKVVGWDDYLISFALAMQFVNNVFATLAIHHGMLIHVYYLTPLEIANVVKWIKAIEMCCIIIPVLIKLSVCISILRLVSNAQRSVTIAIALLMATLSLTGLVTFLVEGMQCLPLRKLWEPMVPGKCMTMETANWVLVAYGIVCIITDFICGIVPILILRKLQMDRTTKVALCLLLGLVLVPGICSIFRTIDTLSLNNPDVTWAVSGVARWVCLEIETGLIISCLPMLWSPAAAAGKATALHISTWRSDYRSWCAWRSGQRLRLESAESSDKSAAASKDSADKLDRYGFQTRPQAKASSGAGRTQDGREDLKPLHDSHDGIEWRRDVDVFTSRASNGRNSYPASLDAPREFRRDVPLA